MKCTSSSELRTAEQKLIRNGVPSKILMAKASLALAKELNFFSDGQPRSVVVVAGKGNNGGDGFGLAAQLAQLGWSVKVWVAASRDQIGEESSGFMHQAEERGVPFRWMPESSDWEHLTLDLPPGAWVVDALLGIGVDQAPYGVSINAISFLNHAARDHRIWSVDVPSGLHPDTGTPFDPGLCVRADSTLTVGAPKKGFLEDESLTWTGSVSVLDIGFERSPEVEEGEWQVLSDLEIREALPIAKAEEHKGNRGHAFFMGGSPGMSGSIGMSAFASLKSGAGLASVLTPLSSADSLDASRPEVMVLPGLQGKFNSLRSQNIDFTPYGAACIGPGLRVNPNTYDFVHQVLYECKIPLILDADALTCFADMYLHVGRKDRPVFLTPHPGEMARLLKTSPDKIQKNRIAAVQSVAMRTNAHVVLKGARSRMVLPNKESYVNFSGNVALATAGTGDVLAGMLAGMLARGIRFDLALPVSVALHGRAGELASIRKGVSSVVAGDVLDALPDVFRYAHGR